MSKRATTPADVSNDVILAVLKPLEPAINGMLIGLGKTLADVLQCQPKNEPKQARLTAHEAMDYLRCSRTTLWELERRGEIKTLKFGTARTAKVLYQIESLNAYLAKYSKES